MVTYDLRGHSVLVGWSCCGNPAALSEVVPVHDGTMSIIALR
jgi:hypothetical protein